MEAENVLVCVTAQTTSHRLIQKAADIAREQDLPLLVLAVLGSGPNLLELPHVAATLDALYARASHVGAEMTIITDKDPQKAISGFVSKRHSTHLVMGQGNGSPNSLQNRLMRELPKVNFHTFDANQLPDA